MKEFPILFNAPMIRATFDGRKTQTRRAFKASTMKLMRVAAQAGKVSWFMDEGRLQENDLSYIRQFSPYGQPGDRLWGRETFFAYGRWVTRFSDKKGRDEWHFIDMTVECDRAYQYAADNPDVPLASGRGPLPGWYKRPAIHMPRRASRLLLEVADIRVERLNDISEANAKAEGVWTTCPDAFEAERRGVVLNHKGAFTSLWESINGPGSWGANPWVWAVGFKRIDAEREAA